MNSIRVGGGAGCKPSVSVGVARARKPARGFKGCTEWRTPRFTGSKKPENGYAFYDPAIDNPMASNEY